MYAAIIHPILTGLLSLMLLCGGMVAQCACALSGGCGDACASCVEDGSSCCCSSKAQSCCAPAPEKKAKATSCCVVDLKGESESESGSESDAELPCECCVVPAMPLTPVIPSNSVEIPTAKLCSFSEPNAAFLTELAAEVGPEDDRPPSPPATVLLCTWRE